MATDHRRGDNRELVTADNVDALNAGIDRNGIDPERIIAVHYEPGHHMALGDNEARYRVLYRT